MQLVFSIYNKTVEDNIHYLFLFLVSQRPAL